MTQKERAKIWYQKHKALTIQRARLWGKENRERRLRNQRKRYMKTLEDSRLGCRKRMAIWRERHPEEDRERYSKNRTVRKQRRRARELGNGGSFTAQQWIALKLRHGSRCLNCGRSERTLMRLGLKLVPDHVRALSRGGTNGISNIQPLCHGKGGCNNHKGVRYIDFRKRNVREALGV
jgi:hypothetical protein